MSSEELTRYYLRRIERFNPELCAFVTVQARRAIRRARALDRYLAKRRGVDEDALPLFYGVPTAIKDLVPVRGTPTRFGSRAFRYFVAPASAATAIRMQKGGFVSLGKLSTSEFGAMPVTEPDIHPPTRNPWNQRHSPGGSSGGSGAAVAAGMVPLAQGSDGGGSVRIPSAFCHLFGFKPSMMRSGNLHGKTNRFGLSVMGPLAHTVEDAAAMMDVFTDAPSRFSAEQVGCLGQSRRRPRPMRIRMCVQSPLGPVAAPIADAVRRTARTLEELGHHIEEVPPIQVEVDEFLPIWQKQLSLLPVIHEGLLQPVTRWLRAGGKRLSMAEVRTRHRELAVRVESLMGDADLMLTPTISRFPPEIGEFAHLAPREQFHAVAEIGAFTAMLNVSGQPAASLPAGLSDDGRSLPYAVQLAGRLDRDGEVLAVCRQLEEAMPWRARNRDGFMARAV